MSSPLNIRSTLIARAKLKEIYAYSCAHWGEKIAGKYMDDLELAIQQAAHDQGGTNNNPKFSTRFTYTPVRKHFIFFEVKDNSCSLLPCFTE